ncbi:MAG: DUF1513 domain-containing protein [Rubrivivax sp.]
MQDRSSTTNADNVQGLSRRRLLTAGLPAFVLGALGHSAPRAASAPQRLATAWRDATQGHSTSAYRVGILEIDWDAPRLHIAAELPVPERAHGLLALADGGFAAVAFRPGQWLLRCDAQGRPMQRLHVDDEHPRRTFNGHVECSADGRWLYTTETDPADGSGWLGVRDARTLQRVAQFASGGVDPHQVLRTPEGALVVANGGILRDASGRGIELARMDPTLALLAADSGRPIGHWRLPDARLGLRHIAWAEGERPLLGIGLQAEHDSADARRDAPAIAIWDGRELTLPCADASAAGYVGDIAAGPAGGFVLSAQKAGRGLWWQPATPQRLTLVAELTEPCALVRDRGAVLIGAGRGLARWHAEAGGQMLRWPLPLAPDNHAALLAAA